MQSDAVCRQACQCAGARWQAQKVGEPGHIFLVSIDGKPFAHQKIHEDLLDASLSQPQDAYVKWGLHYLEGAVAGKSFGPGPTDHDSRIEIVNGNPMDLLPAPTVTKANVDDPKLWANGAKN